MAKKRIPKSKSKKVRARAKGCCEFCMSQEKYASQGFTIDHIIPKSEGGTDELENLCLACQGCNSF